MSSVKEQMQKLLKKGTLVSGRESLLEKRGKMVTVVYQCEDQLCFVIGWFFALGPTEARFKVTSTRFETYESIDIPVVDIKTIEDYQD